MRQRVAAALLGFGLLALLLPHPAHAEPPIRVRALERGDQTFVPDEVLVKFRAGVLPSAVTALLARHGTTVLAPSRFNAFTRLRIPAGVDPQALAQRLAQDPAVEYAEPNFIAHAYWTPNDEFYRLQWHFDNAQNGGIHLQSAWDVEDGDPSVIVAVIDTGVAYENYGTYAQAPDLAQTAFVPGYDFVNEDAHPNDDEGHGTHVTGTIAQSTHNGIGTAGIAFRCAILPVKVLDAAGSGTYADVADGIRFAADHGAKVINMSLGGSGGSTTLQNALSYAKSKGALPVCAAGNNGSSTTLGYPATYNECLAVGATRYDETVSYYSNRGNALDLVAPGGDTRVDQNGDGYPDGVLQQTFGSTPTDWGYYFYQGTSMATPHVSGVAALVIARGAATTPDEVRTALQSTAEDHGATGWDSTYGYGLVDADAAVRYGTPAANKPPVAQAGPDRSATVGQTVSFDGSASSDPDGSITAYAWTFGDGGTASGAAVTHAYNAAGTYTAQLTVTDDDGATATDTAVVTITAAPTSIEVFADSFEVGEWNGLWTEDSQNDWFRSSQRATSGRYSAEVDGPASDAQLISKAINLQGRTNAVITFSWLIESALDANEYLAFDVSANNGQSWTERARLRGNVDPENAWRTVQINLTNISSLRLRFRGRMSDSTEDADVDQVRVTAQ